MQRCSSSAANFPSLHLWSQQRSLSPSRPQSVLRGRCLSNPVTSLLKCLLTFLSDSWTSNEHWSCPWQFKISPRESEGQHQPPHGKCHLETSWCTGSEWHLMTHIQEMKQTFLTRMLSYWHDSKPTWPYCSVISCHAPPVDIFSRLPPVDFSDPCQMRNNPNPPSR